MTTNLTSPPQVVGTARFDSCSLEIPDTGPDADPLLTPPENAYTLPIVTILLIR